MLGARAGEAGFTLIEVMIAIGIMTVGSLGILSMHHAVSGANRSAHEMNTALAITERWIERIERDSLSWSEPGLNSSELDGHRRTSPRWPRPRRARTGSHRRRRSARILRIRLLRQRHATASEIKYCTNLRLSWLRQGSSARVDVRTFWYRAGHMPGTATHPDWVSGSAFRGADCDAATADGWGIGTAPNVDAVFASTVVQWLRRD